jgi:hypothetical protein
MTLRARGLAELPADASANLLQRLGRQFGMPLTESTHDVFDGFGQGHVSPINGHRNRFPEYFDDSVGSDATLALSVVIDSFLPVDTRYGRFADTDEYCFIEHICIHSAVILLVANRRPPLLFGIRTKQRTQRSACGFKVGCSRE